MRPFPTTFAPRDMEDARAVLTDPARHRGHPAIIAVNWAFLKEARGQTVRPDRLAPHHLIGGPRPVDPPEAPFIHIDDPDPLLALALAPSALPPLAPPGLIARMVSRITGGAA